MSEHTHHTPANPAPTPAASAVKTGNKVEIPKAATTLEKVADGKATGADKSKPEPKQPATVRKFRILDGVDSNKFRGQRKLIVVALQKLNVNNESTKADGFTLEQITAEVEKGEEKLISKTPVEASIKFHLNGMLKDKEVDEVNAPAPAAA